MVSEYETIKQALEELKFCATGEYGYVNQTLYQSYNKGMEALEFFAAQQKQLEFLKSRLKDSVKHFPTDVDFDIGGKFDYEMTGPWGSSSRFYRRKFIEALLKETDEIKN